MKMNFIKYTFTIIIVLAVIGFIITSAIDSDKEKINKWAKSKSLEVKKIEVHFTMFNTPFNYLVKGNRIYEVDMANKEKWWIRTGLFSWDYEKGKSRLQIESK